MPCVWVYIGCRVWFYLKENKSEFAIIFKESTILLFNVYINLSHPLYLKNQLYYFSMFISIFHILKYCT